MVSVIFSKPALLWFLLTIPLLILIHFLTLKSTRRKAVQFANFEAISRITGNQILSKNFSLLSTRAATFLFIVLAVAGTTVWYSGEGSEFDFVLAIDSSNSMLVQDFTPNRLESAKLAAKEFVDRVSSGNKIGIVSFASTPRKEHDPSDDYTSVKDAIGNIKVTKVGGTDIGEAIVISTNLLLLSDNPRVIVLLTDGQNNVGTPLDEAIAYANENFASVFTIGMATEEGGKLFGTQAILKLDEETLKNIASSTDGRYFKAEDRESLQKAYTDIAQLTRTKVSKKLTMPFLIIALILLILEWGLANTRYRTIP